MRPLGATPLLPPPSPRAFRAAKAVSGIYRKGSPYRPVSDVPDEFPPDLVDFFGTPRTWAEIEELAPLRYTREGWREVLMLGEDAGILRFDGDRCLWRLTDHGRSLLP